jgi:16S rRNA (uracil1498-N3)-methyltransferase
MSRRRLFVPAAESGGAGVVLTGDPHHHLARVLRARPGDLVTLFDGAGGEIDAEIVRVGTRATELTVTARRTAAAATTAPAVAITLLVAVPRGERIDLIVQKTTELGVGRIIPVLTARSVARPERGGARATRWRTIAREAARQCGRADVPEIDDALELSAALEGALPARRLALWEGQAAGGRSLRAALAGPATATALLVGPEGGFADDELAGVEAAGFVSVGLGPRILRVETAAIVAVALVQATAGGLD